MIKQYLCNGPLSREHMSSPCGAYLGPTWGWQYGVGIERSPYHLPIYGDGDSNNHRNHLIIAHRFLLSKLNAQLIEQYSPFE